MDRLMQCYIEPKQGLLTGTESSLDILLGGRIGHDIQCRIIEFLDRTPGFPDEPSYTSYIEFYDGLMNSQILPVQEDEYYCFQSTDANDEDFIIGEEFLVKDGDDAFLKQLYRDNF
jgi:hypothetical protein|tara:strand:+ start:936 stop:1283 length:348 start_codon:yes stop_codon:yes gene_type:complete